MQYHDTVSSVTLFTFGHTRAPVSSDLITEILHPFSVKQECKIALIPWLVCFGSGSALI